MRKKFTVVALILLVIGASGCSSPWVQLSEDSKGWFQNGHSLYYCRVTAYDKIGLPMPICVRAGVTKLNDLKKPYTRVAPTLHEGPSPQPTTGGAAPGSGE